MPFDRIAHAFNLYSPLKCRDIILIDFIIKFSIFLPYALRHMMKKNTNGITVKMQKKAYEIMQNNN